MEGIQIAVESTGTQGDIHVVKISGYIDTTTSGELERVIQGLLREQHYKMVIDLQNVDYISSAGWGIFISEIKNIRTHHGDLKLACMSETVNEVYELLEFSTILTAAPTVADAAGLFEPGSGTTASKPAAPASKPAAPAPKPVAPAPKPTVTATRPATPTPRPAAPAAKPAVPAPKPAISASNPAPAAMQPSSPAQPAEVKPSTSGLLPLIDRIRSLVKAHPDWGAWKLKGELNRRRGTQPKVSWGEVRAELKYNNLGSKRDRFKFARGI